MHSRTVWWGLAIAVLLATFPFLDRNPPWSLLIPPGVALSLATVPKLGSRAAAFAVIAVAPPSVLAVVLGAIDKSGESIGFGIYILFAWVLSLIGALTFAALHPAAR